ncbi:MAG: alpha/beta hydrolase family protein, partial [Bryobacteraceae bacterium]
GLEWSSKWPCSVANPRNGHGPEEYLRLLNRLAASSGDEFFGYETPSDFRREGEFLRFTSAVPTPYPENNTAHGRWFPANGTDAAVLVLPHWNARLDQHGGLCRAIRMLGYSAMRVSPPYHDLRMPRELQRADYAVSSNVGRTIDATRQAVIDTRSCIDWLEQQGYRRFAIVGTSLGSCYAFLAAAHDERLQVNVFNHCSSYFADVVWTGLSTRHIRQGIEQHIDLERLREVWSAISPVNYIAQYARWPKKSKFIYAAYDTTFLPQYSREVTELIQKQGIDSDVVVLPCGHYTLGEAPYKFLDGFHICSFLRRWLGKP